MSKEETLQKAYTLYTELGKNTLGQCIRTVCKQMQSKEHKRLSSLDGSCAECYYNEHYREDSEEQLMLEGM
jgi:hypothetical protein